MFVVGIDGGGTKTRVAVCASDGTLLHRETLGAFNLSAIGEDGFRRRVGEILTLCGDMCAVQRRADTGLLASMWELPNDLLPDAPETGEPCGEAVHIFSHVEWHMRGYIVRCKEKLPGYVWVTRAEREALAMPTAFRYYRKKLEEMGY